MLGSMIFIFSSRKTYAHIEIKTYESLDEEMRKNTSSECLKHKCNNFYYCVILIILQGIYVSAVWNYEITNIKPNEIPKTFQSLKILKIALLNGLLINDKYLASVWPYCIH